jgi:hypothetical protein
MTPLMPVFRGRIVVSSGSGTGLALVDGLWGLLGCFQANDVPVEKESAHHSGTGSDGLSL